MTISYPLAAPTTVQPRSVTFTPENVVGYSQSIFTYQSEVFAHQGERLMMNVQLPPMTRDQAAEWVAFGLALNGREGTFLMGDPVATTPRGAAGGAPVVDGAGQQRTKTLATRGWTPGAECMKAGDWIQVGQRLHMVTVAAAADGSGNATLDIWPRVRDVLVDGQEIITANTKALWRLTGTIGWNITEAQLYGISFSCEEAL